MNVEPSHRGALYRDVGLALARRRVALGLSGRAVGRAVGLSHATISRVECGVYAVRLDMLERLATAVGCTPTERAELLDPIRRHVYLHEGLARWTDANHSLVQTLVGTLGELPLDDDARQAFADACIAIRQDLQARQAGTTLPSLIRN